MTKKITLIISALLFFTQSFAMRNNNKTISYPSSHWISEIYQKYNPYTNNFFEEVPGKLYSSGQLTGEEIKEIKKYKVTTLGAMINLRNKPAESEKWYPEYQEEVKACKMNNIKHYDVKTSCNEKPSKQELHDLVKLYFDLYIDNPKQAILVKAKGGIGSVRCQYAIAVWLLFQQTMLRHIVEEQLLEPFKFTHGYCYCWHPMPYDFFSKIIKPYKKIFDDLAEFQNPLDIIEKLKENLFRKENRKEK